MQVKLKATLSAYAKLNVSSAIEVVDNLTTPDPLKALSANQGFVLKELIDNLPSPEQVQELEDEVAVVDTRVTTLEAKSVQGEQDETGTLKITFE